MKISNKTFRVLLIRKNEFSFPDDVSRDGSRNVGLIAVQPIRAAAGPKTFILFSRNESFRFHNNPESVNIQHIAKG